MFSKKKDTGEFYKELVASIKRLAFPNAYSLQICMTKKFKKFNSVKQVENHQISIVFEEAQSGFCYLIYLVHKISSEMFS